MRFIIFKILIIGIIFSINTFAQTTTKMIHHDLAGMELNIYCENPKISFLNNSVYFPGYVDESNPSSPILPSQTLFIAIPPYSKINLEGQILNKRSY
ncbi:MAG: hypothetical protein GYA60_01675, partial [Candidatus Methanofastidiosa archaeon]|nr:hypothetical protein [Candidatus Methanofastidiosa archaeon]